MEGWRRFQKRLIWQKRLKKAVEKISELIVVLLMGFLFAFALVKGIEREGKRECYQWQQWARELNNFYLTPVQKQQCDRWGIGIQVVAPVKSINLKNLKSLSP